MHSSDIARCSEFTKANKRSAIFLAHFSNHFPHDFSFFPCARRAPSDSRGAWSVHPQLPVRNMQPGFVHTLAQQLHRFSAEPNSRSKSVSKLIKALKTFCCLCNSRFSIFTCASLW